MEYIGDLSEAIHKPITNLDTELKFVVNKDAAVAAAENNAPETPAKAVSPKRAIRKKRGRDEEDDTEPNKRIKVEETEDDLVEQSDKWHSNKEHSSWEQPTTTRWEWVSITITYPIKPWPSHFLGTIVTVRNLFSL